MTLKEKLANCCSTCKTIEYPPNSGQYIPYGMYEPNDYSLSHEYLSKKCLLEGIGELPEDLMNEITSKPLFKQLPQTCSERIKIDFDKNLR